MRVAMALVVVGCAAAGPAQPTGSCSYVPENRTTTCPVQFEQIAPPSTTTKAAWDAWMSELQIWRREARANSSWPSKWYDEKDLVWARTSFLQRECFALLQCKYFALRSGPDAH